MPAIFWPALACNAEITFFAGDWSRAMISPISSSLRLDVAQSVQLIVAHVDAPFGESCLQDGFLGLLAEFLDQNRRSLCYVREHNRGGDPPILLPVQRQPSQPSRAPWPSSVFFTTTSLMSLSVALCGAAAAVCSAFSASMSVRCRSEDKPGAARRWSLITTSFFFLCHLFSPPSLFGFY